MSYPISCVLLVPSADRDAINNIAEAGGHGPNNLSVPLTSSSGEEWFGCHTWSTQEFIDEITGPDAPAAMGSVIVSAIAGGPPHENWASTLKANGMTQEIE